jgi:low affinity Fe/Cu permease
MFMSFDKLFARFASGTARATGSPLAFIVCALLVVVWAATGPLFKFSETWQLVINTGTTIVTFLMVFLIQNTQNRDATAVQAKLDELILSSAAENDYIGIEKLTDKDLEAMRTRCAEAADRHGKLAEKLDSEMKQRRAVKPAPTRGRKPAATKSAARAPKRAQTST